MMNSSTHSGSDGHGYPSCSGYVGRCPTCLEKLSRDQLISMLEHGEDADGDDAGGGAAESELDPVDPADPVVSAAATAIGDTAAPTPRATANAPTRPT